MKMPASPMGSGGTALAQALQNILQRAGLPVGTLEHSFIEPRQCESSIVCMSLDTVNNLIITGGYDHILKSYDLQSGRNTQRYVGHKGWVSSLYIHPQQMHIVSGSHDATAKIWDVKTGKCLKTFPHEDVVYGVATDASGRYLYTGCMNGSAYRFDIASGTCMKVFQGHSRAIRCIALTSDGKKLISSSNDGTIRTWDVVTGDCLMTLVGHSQDVYSVMLSIDEKYLASGSQDETARLWDLTTGKCLRVFSGHDDPVRPVFLSDDGTRLVTGSFDTTAKLWDTSTGECLVTYKGEHTDWLRCVRLSSDSKRLITGSKDGTVCFWDTLTGKLLVKLHNIDKGFLWSTPPCSGNSSGFFWTDREDLVQVRPRQNRECASSRLPNDDIERTEYLASHNNRVRVMQKIHPHTEMSDRDSDIMEKLRCLGSFEQDMKQLARPNIS